MLFGGLSVAVVESQEGAVGFRALRRLDFLLLDQPFDGGQNIVAVANERLHNGVKRCPRGPGRLLRRHVQAGWRLEFSLGLGSFPLAFDDRVEFDGLIDRKILHQRRNGRVLFDGQHPQKFVDVGRHLEADINKV